MDDAGKTLWCHELTLGEKSCSVPVLKRSVHYNKKGTDRMMLLYIAMMVERVMRARRRELMRRLA